MTTARQHTTLISPIKGGVQGVGGIPKVIYGEDGLSISFYSPTRETVLILTDEGWLPESTHFDFASGYSAYARNFKNLVNGKKSDAIDAIALPSENNNKPPLVISHRHTLALVKKLQETEERLLAYHEKNNTEQSSSLSAHYNHMVASVARVEQKIEAVETKLQKTETAKKTPVSYEAFVSYSNVEHLSDAEEKLISNRSTPWRERLLSWISLFGRKNDAEGNTPSIKL